MFIVGVGAKTADDTRGNEEGYDDRLPEREEEDAFDGEEFRHRAAVHVRRKHRVVVRPVSRDGQCSRNVPEWLKVVRNTEPEHSQTIQAQTNACIVYDTDIEVS